jgi:hypothetical protein
MSSRLSWGGEKVVLIVMAAMLAALVAPRVGFAFVCGVPVLHLRPEQPRLTSL